MANIAKDINRLALSGDEITALTKWDDSMVTDYLGIHEGLLLVADAIDAIASKTPPPATATSPGLAGEIAFDASFFYVCIATDTWRRVGIATW